jgi:hypothetical protein
MSELKSHQFRSGNSPLRRFFDLANIPITMMKFVMLMSMLKLVHAGNEGYPSRNISMCRSPPALTSYTSSKNESDCDKLKNTLSVCLKTYSVYSSSCRAKKTYQSLQYIPKVCLDGSVAAKAPECICFFTKYVYDPCNLEICKAIGTMPPCYSQEYQNLWYCDPQNACLGNIVNNVTNPIYLEYKFVQDNRPDDTYEEQKGNVTWNRLAELAKVNVTLYRLAELAKVNVTANRLAEYLDELSKSINETYTESQKSRGEPQKCREMPSFDDYSYTSTCKSINGAINACMNNTVTMNAIRKCLVDKRPSFVTTICENEGSKMNYPECKCQLMNLDLDCFVNVCPALKDNSPRSCQTIDKQLKWSCSSENRCSNSTT